MRKPKRKNIIIAALISCLIITLLTTAADDDLKPVPEPVKPGFESISESDIQSYMEFLSSDEMEGRNSPSKGLTIAGHYVKSLYKLWGIEPAGDSLNGKRVFDQKVPLIISEPDTSPVIEVYSSSKTQRFINRIDYTICRAIYPPMQIDAPVVFAGYGISAPDLGYDDLKDVDLNGKVALILFGYPGKAHEDSLFRKSDVRSRFYYRGFYASYEKLIEKGAVAVLVVTSDADVNNRLLRYFPDPSESEYKSGGEIQPERQLVYVPGLKQYFFPIPTFVINEHLADALLDSTGETTDTLGEKIDGSLVPKSFQIAESKIRIGINPKETRSASANILGMIRGSDAELQDEYIVVGAHLDHIGMSSAGHVFNGADDNASGSAAVLEIAQAFAMNPDRPKRSILFAHWTAEEKGLLGARYFVEFPTVPRGKIVAYLNMDCISRELKVENLDMAIDRESDSDKDVDKKKEMARWFSTAMISSQAPGLQQIIINANKNYIRTYCFPQPSKVLGGSDHAAFHDAGIPSAGFFGAFHADLHKPVDTVDKCNFEKAGRIAALVYLTACELANNADKPKWIN